MTANTNNDYDLSQDVPVDSTRGSILTDVQMSVKETPMPSATRMMALNDTTTHDIKTILERPVNLGTFSWSTSSPRIDFKIPEEAYLKNDPNYLQQFNFPQDIFAKSPIVVDKLKNYQYLKADIEIEVKVNAQPFLAGALMLVYNPYYNQVRRFRRDASRYMASQTSCPHKIMSIEDSNSLKLTLPYCNIYDLFDLSNSQNQFGTAFLYVFAPLVGVNTEETVSYTVFARFVNPQFYVPTSKDVISEQRTRNDINRLEKLGYTVAQSDIAPVATGDTGEVEVRGPVSKAAAGVAMVSEVAGAVPLIGPIASSVAWVSRAIQRTAASLGWSKPTSIVPQCKVVNKPMASLIHSEGNDDASTLALLQDNGIDGSSFIPETKDEMALNYIFSRPNYFMSQVATDTAFSGRKLIMKWEVSPFSAEQYGETTDPNTLFLGSFAYASMLGSLWRGSIHYDIRIIKTPYHNGRFAVVFFPETNLADVPEILDNELNTNYNTIFNLKDTQDDGTSTIYRYTVPFISNTPWRETYRTIPGTTTLDATTLETKTGSVAIYALTSLSAPETVLNQVTFYIAHSGGDDYQVARPFMNLTPGYTKAYAQADVGPAYIPEDDNLLVPSHKTTDVTAQTTGEYFKSLRSFIKRFTKLTKLQTVQDQYLGFNLTSFQETIFGRRTYEVGSISPKIAPTPFYMTSFLYRFFNGSVSTKLVPPSPWATIDAYVSVDDSLNGIEYYTEDKSIGQPVFEQNQGTACAFEVRTPYYRGIRAEVVSTDQSPLLGGVRTNYKISNNAGIGTYAPSSMYEAAGDDFNFFFLVGPPPMCDIGNLKSTTILPDVRTISVNFSNVNTLTPSGLSRTATPITTLPSITPQPGIRYGIYDDSGTGFTLTYTDTTTRFVSLNECAIYQINASSDLGIIFELDTSKGVNNTATAASIAAMGSVSLLTTAPLS